MFRVFACLGGEHDWRLVMLAGIACLSVGLAVVLLFHCLRAAASGRRSTWMADRHGMRAAIGVPLTLIVAILPHSAAMAALDQAPATGPFAVDDRTLAFTIAGIVLALLAISLIVAIIGRRLVAGRPETIHPSHDNSQARLRQRNAFLDAALNNMTQGLCMFDADERVVVLNRRFLEMYKLSPQVVRPGCTLIELLRHRKEVGLLELDPDQFYAALKRELATGQSTQLTHRTSDNRYILAHNQPMPGGGWVTTHEDMTEQRNAEHEIREQKLKLDAALNNMSQGLCMYDATGHLIVCNQRYMQLYNLTPDDVRPGCTLWDLLVLRKKRGLLKDDPQKYIDGLKKALAGGKGVNFVVELNDGRVLAVANRPLSDGRWVSTHEDITEHQLAEQQLNEQKLQLDAALNNMSQGLCLFNADARLMFCNLRYTQMYGMSPEDVFPGMTLQQLLERRQAQGTWSRDIPQYLAELHGMLAKGETVTFTVEGPGGRLISIYNRPMPDGRWVSCHEDITEERRAESLLREQKLHLDAALKNMSQGLCMFDADGRIVVFNPRYAEMMGVSAPFLNNCTFLDLMRHRKASGQFLGDPDALNVALLKAMREGKGDTKVVERGDGRVHQIGLQPMATGGWVATLEDITERRIAQERLREQKLQLDAALNNMSQGLCMFDAEGRIVLFNPRYTEIIGFPPDFLRGLSFAELLKHRKAKGDFAGDPESFSAAVIRAAREGKIISKVVQQASGRTHRIVVQPRTTGGWVSTLEDITEQRRAEEQLREQKIQLDTALNNMSQGLTMFDADGRLVVLNDRYLKMYGLRPSDVTPGCTAHDLVQARIANGTFFSADPNAYTAELLAAMKRREPTHTEMELPDGRVIAIASQSTADGNGWVVTHEDITERRRAEQERDRSRVFASTVIENVPSTIVVKDARTLRYVLVNRAGEGYFGTQREAMIGKTSEEVFDADTAKLIADHDQTLLRTGRAHFYDEHPTKTPGAGPRIVTTMRTPIRDEQGEMAYLLTVIEDRTNRKRAEAQIAHMAHHDPVTGLPNRSAFNECLNSTIEAAASEGTSFSLMSLDLDRFKEVNDVFGHVVGDDLLCEISRRLQKTIGGAFVARLGGDEFTVISIDGEQPAAAEALADQVLTAVAEEFNIDGHQLRLSISIGVSIFPTDGTDAATLVANADAALYRAKSEGRGIYRFFEAGMDKSLRERRALQHDLQTAIEHGELTLYYQPQARISGETIGFEALVRWRHPTRGMISPGSFIPLAEESGLIVPMGEWILREACREAASWDKPLQIGINLSPVQFRHGDLVAVVHSVLLETGLAPSRLELEITEGVLIGDFSRALSILRRLKALGVRIAMDDFGTGYSSLSYLQSFPFDKIKIDQAFISNLESNPQSATIIRAVIGLARGLNLPVLAEGVETEEQLAFLASEKCDEVQGYLIGRPQPIEHYAALTGHGSEPLPSRVAAAV